MYSSVTPVLSDPEWYSYLASYPAFTMWQVEVMTKRTPGFSHLHMHQIFPEIRETMLFRYFSA